jgi:hypothetical protein
VEILASSVQYHLIPEESAKSMPQDNVIAKHVVIQKVDGSQVELDVFQEVSPLVGDLKRDYWVEYDGKWLGKVVSQRTIPEDQKASTSFANIQRLQELSRPEIELRMKQMTRNGVFRNMNPDRREALFTSLRELDVKGYSQTEGREPSYIYDAIKNGCLKVKEGRVENISWMEIFEGSKKENEEFLDFVLLGMLKGELSETTASTVFTYWSLFTYHVDVADQMVEIDAFTTTGEVNPEAKRMIESTLGDKASEEKLAAFFAELKTLPRSEQRFVTAPLFVELDRSITMQEDRALEEFEALPESTSEIVLAQKRYEMNQLKLRRNIVQVTSLTGENFLGVSGRTRIFAPMGMKQACLNVFTPYPVTLKPRFGAAHIEKAIEVGFRDQTGRSPGQMVPIHADKFSARGASYLEHDMYHAVLQSFVPKEHQALFVRLAEIGDSISEKDAITEMIKFRYYDMENSLYFQAQPGNSNLIFWAQASLHIAVAAMDVEQMEKPEILQKLKRDSKSGLTPGVFEYAEKIFEVISADPSINMESLIEVRAKEIAVLKFYLRDPNTPSMLKLWCELKEKLAGS